MHIDSIKKYELYEIEALNFLKNDDAIDKTELFIFGRSFVYACNILDVYFNDPSRLTDFEVQEAPKYIDLFKRVGFDLSVFEMKKEDLCKKLNIDFYTSGDHDFT